MTTLTDRQAEEMLRIMRKSYLEMRRQKCPLIACNQLARVIGMLNKKYLHGKKKDRYPDLYLRRVQLLDKK